eukprot:GFKZ01002263.1.p1 GENE.GFKZ01002263.1~~GFKZ01002263.1.p1  ORF type:complete len:463 (+),score=46.90 GFKZ01002263.1:292-1680(+)
MSISNNHTLLTASEIDRLTPPSPSPPLPTNLSASLDPIVSLLNQDWVTSFLFSTDPLHFAYLSTPTVTQSAFLCQTSVTRVAATPPQPDPSGLSGLLQTINGQYVLVPAFSLDSFTVGVGVMDLAESSRNRCSTHAIYPRHPGCRNVRFARNTQHRYGLILHDAPDTNLMSILFSRFQSTTHTYFLNAVFNREQLMACVRHGSKAHLRTGLLRAIRAVASEQLMRKCPFCGAEAKCGCDCKFPSGGGRGGMLTDFKMSMRHDLGVYEGVLTRMDSACGAWQGMMTLGSFAEFQGEDDAEAVQRFCQWSVASYYESEMGDPRRSRSLTVVGGGDAEGDQGQDSGGEVRDVIREMKVQERKARNRASALRSKRKRKERGLELGVELERWGDKVRVLRERELWLRRENNRLKELVWGETNGWDRVGGDSDKVGRRRGVDGDGAIRDTELDWPGQMDLLQQFELPL